MRTSFTESIVEEAALAWLEALGYAVLHGLEIALGEPGAKRTDHAQIVLESRFRDALATERISGPLRIKTTEPAPAN